jgi:GNAT superfamily N-acetyltransferase
MFPWYCLDGWQGISEMLGQVEIRSLGYRTDVMARRAEGSEIIERDGYVVVRTPANPDFYWGNFLLLARPPQGTDLGTWPARFAAEFPAARHAAFGIDVGQRSAVDLGPFTAAGFTASEGNVMTAAGVREPPHRNSGVHIRTLTGDADWLQSLQLRVACYGEPGNGEFLARRTAQARFLTEQGHGAWFGAFSGGRLVCQAGLVWSDAPMARYQDVETRPSARRQGLAGTLVWQAGLAALARPGITGLVIVADPGDVAERIYHRLGFTSTEDQIGFQRTPPAGA